MASDFFVSYCSISIWFILEYIINCIGKGMQVVIWESIWVAIVHHIDSLLQYLVESSHRAARDRASISGRVRGTTHSSPLTDVAWNFYSGSNLGAWDKTVATTWGRNHSNRGYPLPPKFSRRICKNLKVAQVVAGKSGHPGELSAVSRGTAVERRSFAGEPSRSCARPVADWWPLCG